MVIVPSVTFLKVIMCKSLHAMLLIQHSWEVGLLVQNLSVIFQAQPQVITKALPDRSHQEAVLPTPDSAQSCASPSEGKWSLGPRSPQVKLHICNLSLALASLGLSLRPWAEVFFRCLWRTSSWGKGKPGRHFPPPRVSAQYFSTLDPSFSPVPYNPRVYKSAGDFCSGLP